MRTTVRLCVALSDQRMSNAKFHFISGLPRSGSTMLAAILRQNPRFHAGMTSPVGSLFSGLIEAMSADKEGSDFITDDQRKLILRGVFENYYAPFDQEVIVDTNRLWCSCLHTLLSIFPDSKVVACVRNPAWIMDSVERLVRKNQYQNSRMFNNHNERMTVYSRCDALAQPGRFVGFPYYALKQAYFSAEAEHMLLVDYDLLCSEPKQTLKLIYGFLGEEFFKHDFENLEYSADSFDQRLGMKGLHEVKRSVSLRHRDTILPPDLFQRFAGQEFWTDMSATKASVIVASRDKLEEIPKRSTA